MRQITKGAAPEVLLARGVQAAAQHRASYEADPAAYEEGRKTLKFKPSIYGHKTVREALEAQQYGKCAYCETIIPKPYADGHIDHWRPKGAVKPSNEGVLLYPGYYWLAYDWDNLLLSCQFCNRGNKRALFPLEDEAQRARHHGQPIDQESPRLLKPDGPENPSAHIEFIDELPRGRTLLGKSTIKILGLDRIEHKARDELLLRLRDAHEFIIKFNSDQHPPMQQLVQDCRAFLAQAVLPPSPFSAMAEAFLAAHPLPAA